MFLISEEPLQGCYLEGRTVGAALGGIQEGLEGRD